MNTVMVIVFIKEAQVVQRPPDAWLGRQGGGDQPQYALRTAADLRQLNQLYFCACAQDSAQGAGVFGELAIGCGRQRLAGFVGRGRQFVVSESGRSNARQQRQWSVR